MTRLAHRLAILAAGVILATSVLAQDDGPRLGTWNLVGRDTSRWRAELVINRRDGQRYAGRMTWRAVSGEPAGGTEPFKAEYDPATRTLRMRGEPLIGATGDIAAAASYESRVACDGGYLAYGRWYGEGIEGSTWAARHVADPALP